ncbi:MAG: hypothetical protein GC136_00620 [Alphaproteobacteria bacterium]|nr:hypothetical protein [Alphaproteobacteria bacterium]
MSEEHAEGLKRLLSETGYCCAQVTPQHTFVFSEAQIAGMLREAAAKNIELHSLGADLQGEIKRALAVSEAVIQKEVHEERAVKEALRPVTLLHPHHKAKDYKPATKESVTPKVLV